MLIVNRGLCLVNKKLCHTSLIFQLNNKYIPEALYFHAGMCYNTNKRKMTEKVTGNKSNPHLVRGEQELKMARKQISKKESIRRTRQITELAICAVLIASGAYIIKGAFDRSKKVGDDPTVTEAQVEIESTEVPTEPEDPNRLIYSSSLVRTKDKYKGDLILVNNDHQYFTDGKEDLVSILELNYDNGIEYFGTVDMTYTILRPVYDAMVKMIGDFYDIYHNDSLIIYGSYRTNDFQRQLYEQDLANTGSEESTRVAKPGYSEHESGYAFDFSTVPDYDYQGTGDFEWFTKNCCKYGFILRYPENKENITQIQYEPWHFRYVGIPHAYYMTKNDLCMEEYIELLEKQYPYSGEHLAFSDDSGNEYEVYFVASDDANEDTDVPVPNGCDYTVSGNNYSGFIVTVYKSSGTPSPAQTTTASPAQTTTAAPEETSGTEPDEQQ